MLVGHQLRSVAIRLGDVRHGLCRTSKGISLSRVCSLCGGGATGRRALYKVFQRHVGQVRSLMNGRCSPSALRGFQRMFTRIRQCVRGLCGDASVPVHHISCFFMGRFRSALLSRKLGTVAVGGVVRQLHRVIMCTFGYGCVRRSPFIRCEPLGRQGQLMFLVRRRLGLLRSCRFTRRQLRRIGGVCLFSICAKLTCRRTRTLRPGRVIGNFSKQG